MICIKYTLIDNKITYLETSGHANYDEYGKDIVCAGVSAIIVGLNNALDELSENVDIKVKGNNFVFKNNSNSAKVNDYFMLAIKQLETIQETYGKYVRIERNAQ